jgi:hypothetical protein
MIISNLDLIDSGGGTSVSAGLNLSNMELEAYGDPNHINTIILITDAEGLGAGDVAQCYVEADIAASRGILIFTIGLTIDAPAEVQLLTDLANITGGMYFDAPDPSYFNAIYENISSYLTDLAVWDSNMADANPLIRDVLPSWIDYVPGSFNIPPDSIVKDPVTGETTIEWDVQWVKLGETVSLTFDIVANDAGYLETNVYGASRAFYTRWDNTTDTVPFPHVYITVLPGIPLPPRLHISSDPFGDDIELFWEEPETPGTDYFLIYRSTTPTGCDFSTPWIDTSVNVDPGGPVGAVGDRYSWNHTGASDPGDLEYSEQWYYCIRTVNTESQTSYTSRTVGKWTREFVAGASAFSLPLEPLGINDTEYYCVDMGSNYIKYIDPATNEWVQHDIGGPTGITDLVVGDAYEVDFTTPTKYTFLGMPGAMIQYMSGVFGGFDPATEADSLIATIVDPVAGDISLSWGQPASMDSNDIYNLLYSTSRDGFYGQAGTDYIVLTTMPYGSEFAFLPGLATPGTQHYYMIQPENETGKVGASTYSIGIFVGDYSAGYDSIGIPLALSGGDQTADWYSDQIVDAHGINYYIDTEQRWAWHAQRMPEGAYDPTMVMAEGYQISLLADTNYIFIGH